MQAIAAELSAFTKGTKVTVTNPYLTQLHLQGEVVKVDDSRDDQDPIVVQLSVEDLYAAGFRFPPDAAEDDLDLGCYRYTAAELQIDANN